MKLRTILLVLALLAFLSFSSGGYLYYSSLKKFAFNKAEVGANYKAESIKNRVFSFLNENLKSVKAMSGLKELQHVLSTPTQEKLAKANFILDHFQVALDASVSYVMDREGLTLSSSNRNAPNSFVGKNYSFRPYFQQAIHGNPSVYMALGVTSKKRGVYYSHPVYEKGQNGPIGVVVVKASVEHIEKELVSLQRHAHGDNILIADPQGIVFMSSHKEWRYQSLWEISDEKLSEISKTKQFGNGPWGWIGFKMKSRNRVVDASGDEYMIYQKKIDILPGWNAIHLIKLKSISESISAPLIKTIGYITLALCVLIGISVLIMYKMASYDIVKRKQSQEALRKSEEKLRNIVEHSSNLFYSHDPEHKLTYLSPQTRDFFDCEPEQALVLWTEFATDNPINQIGFELAEKAIQTGEMQPSYELELVGVKGRKIWVEVHEAPVVRDGQTVAIVGALTDITERKQAEKSLRESETKYRTLLETTSEGYWLLNPERKTIEVNESLCEMLGYREDEMLGKKPFEFADDENRKIFNEQISKISTSPHRSYEITLKKKNGQDLQTYFNATTIRDESGLEKGSFAFVTNTTERKKAEEERNRLAIAIEQAAESVFITDGDGMIQYVNPAFERLTGYRRKDAIGKTPRILESGKQGVLFYKQMEDTLARGNAWHGRIVNRKKDGSLYEADATISPVLDKSGKITNFVYIKRDITNEIELERRLIQAQKMESIGTLAGGIAHDFNNILFSLSGYTELALDDAEKGTPLHDNLQEVLIAAHRAGDLVKQILTFSRQVDQKLRPLKVQLVVREALKLIRSSLPSTIEINQNISNTCGLVMADATQIHQVAMNLLTNAFHAMEDQGGRLEVTLKEINLDMDDLKDPAMLPGSYVCLIVADTGAGIDKSIIDRIFEPYFSTKEKDKGTGLGLAMVHGIVKSYGGDIRVYSEPGKGSAFHVYLPVIQTQAETKKNRVISPVEGGKERILLVDDEEQIVRMSQQMLERLGYHVTARTSSIETLKAFRAVPHKFDLVITDTTMPNMTGIELARKLMEIRSDIPIIICTGFSEKISPDKATAMGIRGYVMKPIVKSELAKKIREVLDKS
jgi:PAS domain S-box-containing protein